MEEEVEGISSKPPLTYEAIHIRDMLFQVENTINNNLLVWSYYCLFHYKIRSFSLGFIDNAIYPLINTSTVVRNISHLPKLFTFNSSHKDTKITIVTCNLSFLTFLLSTHSTWGIAILITLYSNEMIANSLKFLCIETLPFTIYVQL